MARQCKNCGAIVADDGAFCENCGAPLESNYDSRKDSKGANKTLIILVAVGIILFIIILTFAIKIGLSVFSSSDDNGSDGQPDPVAAVSEEPEDISEETPEPEPTPSPTPVPTPTPTPTPAPPTPTPAAEYIIPDSSIRQLTAADLASLTKDQLRYARNEIYARHGRKFDDVALQSYFNSKSWYHGIIEADQFNEAMLSQIEKDNISLIISFEGR